MREVNGTYYHDDTPDEVIRVLENARIKGTRVRVFYGDTKTGRDWCEEYDTLGVIGRSTGEQKIPLLIPSSQAIGGGGILDHCIVRITIDKRDRYKHPSYHIGKLVVGPMVDGLRAVLRDDEHIAGFNNHVDAVNYIEFLRGNRNRK